MKLLALIALLLAITGWILTALTGTNLLSGYLDNRTCQTDCVQMLFFSAVATGVGGLLLGGISLSDPDSRRLSVTALLIGLPLCAVFATLFIAGNYV